MDSYDYDFNLVLTIFFIGEGEPFNFTWTNLSWWFPRSTVNTSFIPKALNHVFIEREGDWTSETCSNGGFSKNKEHLSNSVSFCLSFLQYAAFYFNPSISLSLTPLLASLFPAVPFHSSPWNPPPPHWHYSIRYSNLSFFDLLL